MMALAQARAGNTGSCEAMTAASVHEMRYHLLFSVLKTGAHRAVELSIKYIARGRLCEPLSRNRKTITPENRKMPQYWLFIQYFRFSHGINRRA
ncbi:TPA: hypothetical protein LUK53_002783 [Escherichia coli]|nr:hypothetical protein [Escherichia coli]